MRLSREKINLLSHLVSDKLASMDAVEFIEDRNTIRLAVVDILVKWLKKEEEVDNAARRTHYGLDGRQLLWVYGRVGHPCRICGTTIKVTRQGHEARVTFWCPQCQDTPLRG